jgi:hypothetical protein
MAENFASFEYRTQEEVLTVLKYLTSILSTTGMQLVEAISPFHLLKQLHEDSAKLGQEPPSVISHEHIQVSEEGQQLSFLYPFDPFHLRCGVQSFSDSYR